MPRGVSRLQFQLGPNITGRTRSLSILLDLFVVLFFIRAALLLGGGGELQERLLWSALWSRAPEKR